MWSAALNGQPEGGMTLADEGAVIDKADENGQTPISWAARLGQGGMASFCSPNGSRSETDDNSLYEIHAGLSVAKASGNVYEGTPIQDRLVYIGSRVSKNLHAFRLGIPEKADPTRCRRKLINHPHPVTLSIKPR